MVDINAGVQDSDLFLMDMLTDMQLIYTVVLTKCDKIKSGKEILDRGSQIVDKIKEKGLIIVCSPLIHLVSAHTQFGMEELKSSLVMTLDQTKMIRSTEKIDPFEHINMGVNPTE